LPHHNHSGRVGPEGGNPKAGSRAQQGEQWGGASPREKCVYWGNPLGGEVGTKGGERFFTERVETPQLQVRLRLLLPFSRGGDRRGGGQVLRRGAVFAGGKTGIPCRRSAGGPPWRGGPPFTGARRGGLTDVDWAPAASGPLTLARKNAGWGGGTMLACGEPGGERPGENPHTRRIFTPPQKPEGLGTPAWPPTRGGGQITNGRFGNQIFLRFSGGLGGREKPLPGGGSAVGGFGGGGFSTGHTVISPNTGALPGRKTSFAFRGAGGGGPGP